jgi:hypothetical protein
MISSSAASFCRGFLMPDQAANALFYFVPGKHHLMAAAHTLQPQVCSDAKNAPLFAAAGVGLFHNQYILKSNFHNDLLAYWA